MRSLALILSTVVGAAQGREYWCLASRDGVTKGEYFGTYRDYDMYKVSHKKSCVSGKLVGEAEKKDGLWIMEFDAHHSYESALSSVKNAKIPILFNDDRLKNILARGGLDLPDKTNLDACGGEVGASIIPVPVSKIRKYPTEHYEVASKNPALSLLLKNANTSRKAEPLITKAIESVSIESLESTITKLQEYHTRNSYSTEIHQATDTIEKLYKSYGFTTSIFDFNVDMPGNVIAVKEGTLHPEKALVLGAHYDSRSTDSSSKTQRAPGADDNASGTSALLEIAKVIHEQDITLEYTLVLCAFAGEEQGLLGSRAVAADWNKEGREILAMFNADMLGYQIPTEPITLGFKDKYISHSLTESVRSVIKEYLPLLPTDYSASCCSDYLPFHEEGYLAVGFFENAVAASSYPHYHKKV
eukprot:TRINITY_DN1143_c0_g3_i1.p1 TRINITY_DN1143_c0_g3~~TRINITY_DN1143_c0_g3_i1.p1  ORF type:complete len:415 (+),score=81.08 TRINITY_DN1143_c0_g3_i1:60-1304(+)